MIIDQTNMSYYFTKPRHWCPRSQPYAGVDSLLGALQTGWKPNKRVFCHETWRGGTRPVIVYYFELKRDDQLMTMPVINSPYLVTLLKHYELEIITETYYETVEA